MIRRGGGTTFVAGALADPEEPLQAIGYRPPALSALLSPDESELTGSTAPELTGAELPPEDRTQGFLQLWGANPSIAAPGVFGPKAHDATAAAAPLGPAFVPLCA